MFNFFTNAYSNIFHNSQKVVTIQMSINRRIKRMCHAHIMEYYSAIKTKEVLIPGYPLKKSCKRSQQQSPHIT